MASVMGVLASDDSSSGILFSVVENSSFPVAPSIPPYFFFCCCSELSAWQTEFRLLDFCFILGIYIFVYICLYK